MKKEVKQAIKNLLLIAKEPNDITPINDVPMPAYHIKPKIYETQDVTIVLNYIKDTNKGINKLIKHYEAIIEFVDESRRDIYIDFIDRLKNILEK